jgi:hypothetical protein
MAFTTDWDTDLCSDATDAIQIDDYINKTRTDVEERLKQWVYGFVAGENDGVGGLISAKLKVQTSVTQTANCIHLYGKDVSSKCECHAIDEDANEVQMTTGGNIGGANVELLAGKDLLGSATSDITINTNKFTVAGATGNTVIAGTLTQQGVATLADTSAMASDAAPAADAQIANKKYVDDQNTADHPAFTGGESHTDGSGIIIKQGVESVASQALDEVTYATPFPTECTNAFCSYQDNDGSTTYAATCVPKSGSEDSILQIKNRPSATRNISWLAIGY